MESKRLATRAMLQRVVSLTKHAHDFQTSLHTTITARNNHFFHQGSTFDQLHGSNGEIHNKHMVISTKYALGPHRKFDFLLAQKLLQTELNRRCSYISKFSRYDPKLCIDLVQELSYHLRRVVKPDILNSHRYKIVILVSIVQTIPDRQRHQSMVIVSRCLWNPETDGSVTVQTPLGYDMLAVATLFAVYTD